MNQPQKQTNATPGGQRLALEGGPHLPPHSASSEELLLKALMGGAELEAVLVEHLKPAHFFVVRNGWIFQAMLDVNAAGLEISYTTVLDRLKDTGQLEEVGGDEALTKLTLGFGGLIPAGTMARTIRQYAESRAILQALGDMARAVYETPQDPVRAFAQAVEMLGKARPFERDRNFMYGSQSIAVYDALIEDKRANQTWYSTPWKTLTERDVILEEGEIVVVVGPEGSGKSAFLYDLAEHYADTEQARTLYIFTEMTLKMVMDRRMAKHGALNYRRLRTPSLLNEGEHERMLLADAEIARFTGKLDYWHAGSVEKSLLFATMLRAVKELGTRVFVIDYLNDVELPIMRGANETSAWRQLLKELEAFANEHKVLIITAAQLNAEGGAYQVGRALKQKASLYLKLNPSRLEQEKAFKYDGRDYVYAPGNFSPIVEVEIEKYRGGARGKVELLYVGPRYTWADKPRDWGMAEPIDLGGAS